jgi:glucosyl-dolichyl phosphate glucuronosyltransferase
LSRVRDPIPPERVWDGNEGQPEFGAWAASLPSCTAVVCAYSLKRWPILREAIASLLDQDRSPLQVILVIDHNPDLLALAADSFPTVEVIANAGPRGSSEAKNTAIARARGEVVAFIDDDAIAAPDWLEQMLVPYRDPAVIGTCGAPVPRWDGERPGWLPEEFLWTVGCAYRGLPEHPARVRNPIGAAMSFRADVFTRVGGFHTGLGPNMDTPSPHGGGEDTELGIRAQRRFPGGSLSHVPSATVEHHVPRERGTFAYFRRRCWLEGRAKALLGATVGDSAGLASERTYVASTLPNGALRNLLAALHGDAEGLRRAAAIFLGLAFTASGWGWERLRLSAKGGS